MKRWWEKPAHEYTEKDEREFIETHVSGFLNKVWTVRELKQKLKRLDESDKSYKKMYNERFAHNRVERIAVKSALKIRSKK